MLRVRCLQPGHRPLCDDRADFQLIPMESDVNIPARTGRRRLTYLSLALLLVPACQRSASGEGWLASETTIHQSGGVTITLNGRTVTSSSTQGKSLALVSDGGPSVIVVGNGNAAYSSGGGVVVAAQTFPQAQSVPLSPPNLSHTGRERLIGSWADWTACLLEELMLPHPVSKPLALGNPSRSLHRVAK